MLFIREFQRDLYVLWERKGLERRWKVISTS